MYFKIKRVKKDCSSVEFSVLDSAQRSVESSIEDDIDSLVDESLCEIADKLSIWGFVLSSVDRVGTSIKKILHDKLKSYEI